MAIFRKMRRTAQQVSIRTSLCQGVNVDRLASCEALLRSAADLTSRISSVVIPSPRYGARRTEVRRIRTFGKWLGPLPSSLRLPRL